MISDILLGISVLGVVFALALVFYDLVSLPIILDVIVLFLLNTPKADLFILRKHLAKKGIRVTTARLRRVISCLLDAGIVVKTQPPFYKTAQPKEVWVSIQKNKSVIRRLIFQ